MAALVPAVAGEAERGPAGGAVDGPRGAGGQMGPGPGDGLCDGAATNSNLQIVT